MVRLSTDAGLKEFDQKLLKTLEEWGWFVLSVGAGDSEQHSPTRSAYTSTLSILKLSSLASISA